MQIYISDASVLIDIERGNLTNAMFSLSYRFAVPDVLFNEELEERHSHLEKLGLIIRSMSGELTAQVASLRQTNSRTSVNDLMALILAREENCPLLTGDKALRNVAARWNIEVHGTIWLVEQMISEEKISVEVAQVAFEHMKNFGSRFPWDEVEKMLKRYSK